MSILDLKLLTDENIDPDLVIYLRSCGFDVFDIVENQLSGSTDARVLEFAVQQNRAVVTHDRDFGTLAIAAGKPFYGIIYLRPGQVDVLESIVSFNALLEGVKDVVPPFILVIQNTNSGVRIRYRPSSLL